MRPIVLAVVGLPGAGKTEASEYIVKKTNWGHVHFGNIVTVDEIKKRGLELNEENERMIREDLRAKGGMGVLAAMSLPKIKELFATSSVLIESHYSWEEYIILKDAFGDDFRVLALFASPETRAARMAKRPHRPLTAEEFRSRDYSQIANLHQAGPIARADWMIINEGTVAELQKNIDQVLAKVQQISDAGEN
ncbi:MAG: AAA family ATPase [Candidatus Liptonbacteria bacterium]|nr:AAA family ATPase [Candidatus Liptonbacteria bacterium]